MFPTRCGAVFMLFAVLSLSPAVGQAIPITGQETALCERDVIARPDTAVFTLYFAPPSSAAGGADLSSSYAHFVHAVASAFDPPTGITMATWPGTFYHAKDDLPDNFEGISCGVGPLTGHVQFRLKKGRVRDLAWELLPDSREVTHAVEHAIRRADSLLYFAGLPTPADQPRGLVRLAVSMTAGAPPASATPVLRVRMPYLRVDSPVEIRDMVKPNYPAAAQRQGVEGDVTLQFVVDENGRVQRESIRVIEANYFDFVDAAATAIIASRYRPARAGGCPVKMAVQQRIRFKTR
jgi:TonB family protein